MKLPIFTIVAAISIAALNCAALANEDADDTILDLKNIAEVILFQYETPRSNDRYEDPLPNWRAYELPRFPEIELSEGKAVLVVGEYWQEHQQGFSGIKWRDEQIRKSAENYRPAVLFVCSTDFPEEKEQEIRKELEARLEARFSSFSILYFELGSLRTQKFGNPLISFLISCEFNLEDIDWTSPTLDPVLKKWKSLSDSFLHDPNLPRSVI